MISKKITIINKLGLHARAAAKLVAEAGHFASHIDIINDDKKVNGKSIMGVMALAATRGTEIEIQAEGEDEENAIAALVDLINNKFGEAK